MLYEQLLTDWLKSQKIYLKYSTYTNYCNITHNQIIPNLGNYEVDQLNNDILQEFILNRLKKGRCDGKGGISQKYAQDIITVLKLTLGKEVEIQLPYSPPKEVEIFEKSDQVALINSLQSNICHKNFGILLTIHTGLRIGELCALRWSDINFDTQLLHINKTMIRTYTKEDGSKLNITPPKTRSSIRTIPLNKWIMQYAVLLRGSENEYIITGKEKYIEPNKYRLYYNRQLKDLDLPHRKFHSLRHTFATRCIECGCDYKSLSELLGHSNVSITMNLYVHPQLELKRKCVELLADYYEH
jgi:integrase|nr:MAG TPA: Integrase [Caudoviricetes sp.]